MTRPYQRKKGKPRGPGKVGPGRRNKSAMFQMIDGAGLSVRASIVHQYCPFDVDKGRWCCGSKSPTKCAGRAMANNYSNSLVSKTADTDRVARASRVWANRVMRGERPRGTFGAEKSRNDESTQYFLRG